MKILHTSDWHLGRSLLQRKRSEEFRQFLEWLLDVIRAEGIEALVVAGDVFDNSTPGTGAQEMYYGLLANLRAAGCRHAVIVGGNHDSPSFLDAPKPLLRALGLHVVGETQVDAKEEEIVVLRDASGQPELIVAATPYLRDRDVRQVEAGESLEEKGRKLVEGIAEHYRQVGEMAARKQQELGGSVPVVATGHLFTAGGQTVEGDGVRELYVGSLAQVPGTVFPAVFDYVALGHLHVPQRVNECEHIRYSGSPIPMGFGEAKQAKQVCVVEFRGKTRTVRTIPVPVFQQLETVRGNWTQIAGRIRELVRGKSKAWLDVVYEGEEVLGNLREKVAEALSGSQLEALRVRNERAVAILPGAEAREEALEEMSADDVFELCLEQHMTPEAQRDGLRATYRMACATLAEQGEAGRGV